MAKFTTLLSKKYKPVIARSEKYFFGFSLIFVIFWWLLIFAIPNKAYARYAAIVIESSTGKIVYSRNSNIPRYQNSNSVNYNPKRKRKLLLNKKEINKLFASTKKKGMTIVPTKMYFNKKGLAKIEIGLGKGRKMHDKREVKKTRDWERQKSRLLKNK